MRASSLVLIATLALACGGTPAGTVSRADFGDAWPLSVESGVLECWTAFEVTFRAPDGYTYAINGGARGNDTRGWRDGVGLLRSGLTPGHLSPLIERGLELCD